MDQGERRRTCPTEIATQYSVLMRFFETQRPPANSASADALSAKPFSQGSDFVANFAAVEKRIAQPIPHRDGACLGIWRTFLAFGALVVGRRVDQRAGVAVGAWSTKPALLDDKP